MNILVPGGCGYIGAWLVPFLLSDHHKVTVYDTQWFGSGHLPSNDNLKVIRGDVRDQVSFARACEGVDAVIYLASVSNNDLCIKEPIISDEVINAFGGNVSSAVAAGIKKFIYASSAAAYGSSDTEADETRAIEPTTPYGKGKEHCEKVLKMVKTIDWIIARSASVCGYSPHQRFDITVNRMVHDAMKKGVIRVNGGKQKRSHIHIRDLADFYRLVLKLPVKGIYNVVSINESVEDSAKRVSKLTKAKIEYGPSTDNRSYSVSGKKALEALDFVPRNSIDSAIHDLAIRFRAGYWEDSLTNPVYMNMAAIA